MTLELYDHPQSTCSQKVRICLAEKGVEWVDRVVDIAKRENLSPDYLAINPNGVVPAFVHDGRPVIESAVMCEYVDERFPTEPRLSPSNMVERAAMRAWLCFIDEVPSMAIRVPSFRNVFLPHFKAMSEREYDKFVSANTLRKIFFKRMGRGGFNEDEYEGAIEQLEMTLARMGAALADHEWLVSDQFTIADVCMTPLIVRLEDLGMAEMMADQPHVQSWYKRVQARPSFAQAYYNGTRISHRKPGFPTQPTTRPTTKAK